MVWVDGERMTKQILMEFLDSKYNGQAFFVKLSILHSVFDSEREAKAISSSFPSCILCERTAPMPQGEVSHDNNNSLLVS